DVGSLLADWEFWNAISHQAGLEKMRESFFAGYATGVPKERLMRARLYEAIGLIKCAVRRVQLFEHDWASRTAGLVERARAVLDDLQFSLGILRHASATTIAEKEGRTTMIPRYLCLPILLTAIFWIGAPAGAQQGSPPQHAQNLRALGTPHGASRRAVASGTPSAQEVEVSRVRISNTGNCAQMIIELGGRVQYQAARISDPDRIYLDIENARLSNELLHQPIGIPSDRCLKAVRVAQNRSDVVRVVLDVARVKDYSVSELADPDRLVVDIHGPADNTVAAANSAPKMSVKTTALAPEKSAPGAQAQASAPTTAPRETAPSPAAGPLPVSAKVSPPPPPVPADNTVSAANSAPKMSVKTTALAPEKSAAGAQAEASAPTTAPRETAPSP